MFSSVSRDEGLALLRLRNIADHANVFEGRNGIIHGERNCEYQLVVFSSVEGTSADVHVQLLGHRGSLVVEGQSLLVDAATRLALLADMHQFATQPVADVHHTCRVDSSLLERLDDVPSCLRFELSLQYVLPSAKVGLGFTQKFHLFLAATLAGLLNLVVIDDI